MLRRSLSTTAHASTPSSVAISKIAWNADPFPGGPTYAPATVGMPSVDERITSLVPSFEPPSAFTMTGLASGKCSRRPLATVGGTCATVGALLKLGIPTGRSAPPTRATPSRSRSSSAEAVVWRMGVPLPLFFPAPPCFLKPDDTDVLEAIDAYVLPLLERAYASFGYLGVVLAMTVESAAIPVPTELILPLAGFSVARGASDPLTGGVCSDCCAVIPAVV